MDLEEIQQYSHKIKKINIKNDNENSQYNFVTIKISINDKKDNEIIRFSAKENSEWLTHQSFDNDYFLEIPNHTKQTTTVYAHYFPSALYDYLEDEQVFSVYDWSELMETKPISQYNNQSYHINDGEVFIDDNTQLINGNTLVINDNGQVTNYTIAYNGTTINGKTYYIRNGKLIVDGYTYYKNVTSTQYDYRLDDSDKLVVRSLLNGSINNFKDPNYKNYTKLIDDGPDISNETEKGYFPLSSRYRGYKYLNAPNIQQNTLPYWNNSAQSNRNCNRENDAPYWQAKIHRSGLSPLIAEEQDNKYVPINVYLNYQYLPTSTEYHQHYYGFEPKNSSATNGMWTKTPYNVYTVLDGENLTTINRGTTTTQGFGQESTYRIINYGNPFDDRYEITVPHDRIIDINLEAGQNYTNNCEWEQNQCPEGGYWIYTPKGQGEVSINVELEEDEPYKLRYYMYIPSDSIVEYDSCTVHIEHQDDFGTVTNINEIGKNEEEKKIWMKQDKILRDQWIYHELDFIAEQNNRIVIKGAQHNKNDRNIETEEGVIHTKENYELINEDKVFFTNFQLIKMGEYSPTLKYTETGLYLVEQDQYTYKGTSELDEAYNKCENTPPLTEADKWEQKTSLPIPIKDVYVIFDDDFDIIYNEITSELSWTSYIENCVFSFLPYNEYTDEQLSWQTDDNIISLMYDKIGNSNIVNNNTTSTGQLKLYRKQKKTFTTGANNSFTLILQDSNGNRVQTGKVECAIVRSVADKDTPCEQLGNSYGMCLGERTPDEYGKVTYNKLNFKKLQPSDSEITYYLRVRYINPCYDKDIVTFKPLIFEREQRNMKAYINTCTNAVCSDASNCCILKASSIYNSQQYKYVITQGQTYNISSVDELPLRIDVNILNQLGVGIESDGYCELSINDKIIQSTITDSNGVADFYIDYEDLYGTKEYGNYNDITKHTIKIEYFTKYDESINFLYFDLTYSGTYDTRPGIPIKLYSISPDSLISVNSPIVYTLNRDEIFILNIDTEGYKDFSISVKVNSNTAQKQNITESDNVFIIIGTYNNQATDTYTISTKNLSGHDNDGTYREVKRTFKIKWV